MWGNSVAVHAAVHATVHTFPVAVYATVHAAVHTFPVAVHATVHTFPVAVHATVHELNLFMLLFQNPPMYSWTCLWSRIVELSCVLYWDLQHVFMFIFSILNNIWNMQYR